MAPEGGRAGMVIINILLGFVAFSLIVFLMGNTNPPMSEKKHRDLTIAFVAVLIFTLAVNIIA
jgi:hypothetical protein